MIEIYSEYDDSVWVPVARDTAQFGPRAFLPSRGFDGKYYCGYKAEPENLNYFEALILIQTAFENKESKIFKLKDGDEEHQYKAKWRHGNGEGAPLLGPTKGWVKVPLSSLGYITAEVLSEALDDSDLSCVDLLGHKIPSVLCNTVEELNLQVERLTKQPRMGIPQGQKNPSHTSSRLSTFVRDAAVVAYILREAHGTCESCKQLSPFIKPNGAPFLEVHHVKTLAEGGSDTINNAVALCPNCHREFHHGQNAEALKQKIYESVARLIRE